MSVNKIKSSLSFLNFFGEFDSVNLSCILGETILCLLSTLQFISYSHRSMQRLLYMIYQRFQREN